MRVRAPRLQPVEHNQKDGKQAVEAEETGAYTTVACESFAGGGWRVLATTFNGKKENKSNYVERFLLERTRTKVTANGGKLRREWNTLGMPLLTFQGQRQFFFFFRFSVRGALPGLMEIMADIALSLVPILSRLLARLLSMLLLAECCYYVHGRFEAARDELHFDWCSILVYLFLLTKSRCMYEGRFEWRRGVCFEGVQNGHSCSFAFSF